MKIQKRQEIEFFGTKTGNANSIALGYATETKNFGEVAVGVMNKSTAAKDPNSPKGVCVDSDATLFSVGCGGGGERKNALEVKGDGSVLISGEDGDINVADKIKQALDTNASIELVKSAESDLQYTLMVNNESRGSINIPKDQFLKNVTYDTEAKQLVFTFVTLDDEEHVERISINDLKDVYTAGDGINIDNNVISADFSSVMTAISDEKTQRETTDNEIKSTLDTKADSSLENYCFRLGNNGEVSAPYKEFIVEANIIQLNDNGEYMYGDVNGNLADEEYDYVYDKTYDKCINITKISEEPVSINAGDFFKTDEPLDLTHTFYLDNEQTGVVENLTQLTIEESNIFVNLPYVEVNDNLDDNEAPQYIYDATDNKWIIVVKTYYIERYTGFNTEEPLDLSDVLYYSNSGNVLGCWNVPGYYSTSIGYKAFADDEACTAIGYKASSGGDYSIAIGANAETHSNWAICIGCESNTVGDDSIVIGRNTVTNNKNTIFVGNEIKTDSNTTNCIAIGGNIRIRGVDSVAMGRYATADAFSVAIGYSANAWRSGAVAIGDAAYTPFIYSTAIGHSAKTGGNYAIALGNNVSNTKSIFGVGFDGVNGIDMDRDNYGLYLKGFGGYDGTNLVVTNGDTEALNPNIKSVQQIINEKADASTIPIKVSELYNDSEFLTQTYLDESFEHFRENYYDKSEIDNKGYLTAHQSLDGYAKQTDIDNLKADVSDYVDDTLKRYVTIEDMISSVSTKADLVDGKLKVDQLPKLDNIAAATTTEDMITKFNALLTDLKAKGYMTADITA